ncbi:unnamed protein product [Rhizophagus irregularis]|nr:unnamed protein product [Rhizophagus irregularis]
MFAILNLETNELTLTEPNERLDNNFSQTDEFGIYIIDDSKNNAIEMKVGGSFKDWDMIQYSKTTIGLTPKNLCLPQLVLDKIRHYTIDGRLGAGQQYDLLIEEFP